MQQGGIKVEGKFQECDVVCGSRVYPREIMAREIARLEDDRRAQAPQATWWTAGYSPVPQQNPPYTRQVKRVIIKYKLLGDLLAEDGRAAAAENEIVRRVLQLKHRLNNHHRDDRKIRERITEVVARVRDYVAKADVVGALAVLA